MIKGEIPPMAAAPGAISCAAGNSLSVRHSLAIPEFRYPYFAHHRRHRHPAGRRGRYSLDDLHRAAGGADKHRPGQFTRTEAFKALVDEMWGLRESAHPL